MPRLDNKIAIVDIETTGPNIDEGDRIIQIGAIIISNGNIVNTYTMLINPEREIPDHIVKLTGIEEKDVMNAPKFQSVASLWYERLKDCVFVAHNLGFDLRILKESFARFDLDFSPIALDSVILSKIIVPTAKGFNLTDLSHHFNFDYKEAHDALSDALITADIINKLAQRVVEIPVNTLDQMKVFLKHLKHEEILFFEDPQRFMLNNELHDYKETINLNDQDFTARENAMMAEFIHEEWTKYPYLVIEDTARPVDKHMVFKQIAKNSKDKYILSFSTLDELNYWAHYLRDTFDFDIALLKSQHHYLHQDSFEHYIQHYNFNKDNQQELLVIAATIHWLSHSKFADYSEINKELSVKSLLDKHKTNEKDKKPHYNFELARKDAMNHRILLTNDLNLLSIVNKKQEVNKFVYNRKLIIINLPSLYHASQFYLSHKIEVSGLISLVMTMYDEVNQLYPRGELTQLVNRNLQSIRDKTHSVIDIISLQFDEEIGESESHTQDDVDLYWAIDSVYANQVLKLLKDIKGKLIDLFNTFNNEKDTLKLMSYRLSMIQQVIDSLIHLTNGINKDYFILISATRINKKYYNISLSLRAVVIAENQTEWLSKFKQVLLLSPGNYYNNELSGQSTWFKLSSDFYYKKLPSLSSSNLNSLVFPLEYVQGETDNQRLNDLVDFIDWKEEKLSHRIIILLANQEMVTMAYKKLIQNDVISEDYHIFAQSITGSLNRIRRRLHETDKSIVILKERSFTQLFWEDSYEDTSIILFNLPFESPEKIENKAQFEYMNRLNSNFEQFDHLILPKMIQRLKEIVNFIEEHYRNNTFYLFDNRLYSKYYSKTVHDALNPTIEIDIK